MENEKDQFLTDKDLFQRIWFSPREVFRYIIANHYEKYSTAFLVLAGISRAFDRASLRDMGDSQSLSTIIIMCIIAGGLFGWISFYIYAALVSWTGGWLGGKADTKSILRMLSYGMLPTIIALLFLIPQIIVYGNEIFKSDGNITSAGLLSIFFVYGSMLVEFVLGIWTIVLCVAGISEVQKLAVGKTILNLLLPVILIFIPIVIIVMLIAR